MCAHLRHLVVFTPYSKYRHHSCAHVLKPITQNFGLLIEIKILFFTSISVTDCFGVVILASVKESSGREWRMGAGAHEYRVRSNFEISHVQVKYEQQGF